MGTLAAAQVSQESRAPLQLPPTLPSAPQPQPPLLQLHEEPLASPVDGFCEDALEEDHELDDGNAVPPPIIQVGDHCFYLPPPALAVRRIGEIWRPGAMMSIVTTQHYGTPLLCFDGNVSRGLVNLAPTAEHNYEAVPLFWQNTAEIGIDEAEVVGALGGRSPLGGGRASSKGGLGDFGALGKTRFRHQISLEERIDEAEEEEDEEENHRSKGVQA